MATLSQCVATLDWQQRALAELKRLRVFGDVPESELSCLVAVAEDAAHHAGTVLLNESDRNFPWFIILLEGRVRITRGDGKGGYLFNKLGTAPSFMGEVGFLAGMPAMVRVVAETETRGLQLSEDNFWHVMTTCPAIRNFVRAEMAMRVRGLQQQQAQQEKMAMLGTMTAGLMHELNNPGAAASRAAAQLRTNLQRMHELARGFSERGHTPEQRACLSALQDRVLSLHRDVVMSSLEQSDAEEHLGEWMDARGLEHAWEFAPVLVSSGVMETDLECLAHVFNGTELVDPVEWLEATASSMQMVGLVEESVTRVVELARAVKSYAHEGQTGSQEVDVNQSIHATMVMLKHKFREKNVEVDKQFAQGLPKLHCACSGLNQVWTNLLDNALDAVPNGGSIAVRTALAGSELQVSVHDNGAGISPENQERIFDPFFTTKAAGVGSGLGLGIVVRLLEAYDGHLTLRSQPGDTEFTVHIPTDQAICR